MKVREDMKKTHKFLVFILLTVMAGFVVFNSCQATKVIAGGINSSQLESSAEDETEEAKDDDTKIPTDNDGTETPTDDLDQVADIQISIGEGQSTPESNYGKPVKITIPLVNYGKDDAYNVIVSPVLDSSSDVFPYEIKQMNYEKPVKDGILYGTVSKPNKEDRTRTIEYNFTTRADVTTGYKKISFLITYETVDGTKESITKDLYVKTIGAPEPTEPPLVTEPIPTPEAPISVPRVIVSGFTTQPSEVKAGEQFTLTLHITNTSSKTAVNNIEFNIQSETDGADPTTAAAAFLPVAGSNTVFLKSIGKEETKDISIDLIAKADLAQKPYIINLGMKYEDSKANQYTSEASVSIPVKQEARIEVADPQVMPNAIMVGQESNVMFSIYNIGKTKLYNVSVKYQGDSISGGEAFAGNIEPGATGNIDSMLMGQMPTMDDGTVKVIISYEDESGNESIVEKEITLFVNEPFIDEEFPTFPGEELPLEEEKSKGPFVIGLIFFLIIGVVIFIIRKRRKMKMEGFEEDEIS